MVNILLTSAGRRAYIVDYFKSASGIGKVFASNSIYTIALKRADGYFLSPLIYDDSYIPSIIDFCKQQNISAVLSLFDIDLLVLAKHTSDFERNEIHLILAPQEFVEICNDKYHTYEFLLSLNIPTPKTFVDKNKVLQSITKGELSFPIIMKPRWGMASMGVYKVYDEQELEVLTKRCRRDIFASYLKFESSLTPDNAIIYQECIDGNEFGLDVLNDLNGNYINTFAKQKVTMRSGETDLGKTVPADSFYDIGKTISENSGHKGILSVDCFQCKDGSIYVIEMNCRISGHYPLSYLAGFNYPQLLVDWLNGKPTDDKLLHFEEGLYIVKDLCPMILRREK